MQGLKKSRQVLHRSATCRWTPEDTSSSRDRAPDPGRDRYRGWHARSDRGFGGRRPAIAGGTQPSARRPGRSWTDRHPIAFLALYRDDDRGRIAVRSCDRRSYDPVGDRGAIARSAVLGPPPTPAPPNHLGKAARPTHTRDPVRSPWLCEVSSANVLWGAARVKVFGKEA